MIIPIKCTCGKVIANQYRYYLKEVSRIKMEEGKPLDRVVYLTQETIQKTPEGRVLDELKIKKQCCRTRMLTHVDIL